MADHALVDPLAALDTAWHGRHVDRASLVPDHKGTIVSQTTQPLLDEAFTAPELLPRILLQGESGTPEIRLGATLGQGGMGVVRSATQLSLGREVAVKTGRREVARQLLQEARLTGALEHPNVVPVHALGRNAEGDPLLVMKRVDGVSWRELIDNPSHPLRQKDARSALELHLDILLQVCNAVSFAHSKGIAHRDIKPDNVMVGPFGEVYLLDWGIAVGIGDTAPSTVPHARQVCSVAGTPRYMAPEMVAADGAHIDERTDVYLLGAVLHECVTGQPRHTGATIIEVLQHAYASAAVDYGPDVPRELARICNRATAFRAEDRYPSVEALRQALTAFLQHRTANRLAEVAHERLGALRGLLDGAREHVDAVGERDVHARFGECRLGFQEALRAWPESPEARAGLASAIELMVQHHLARKEVAAAGALLADLDAPRPELERRLRDVEHEVAEEHARVERLLVLEQERDLSIGRRTRTYMVLVLAVVYTVVPLLMGLAMRRAWFEIPRWAIIADGLLFVVMWGGGTLLGRRALLRTQVNRQMIYATGAFGACLVAVGIGTFVLGLDPRTTVILVMPIVFMLLATLAATVDRRLAIAAGLYLLGFFVACANPRSAPEVFAVANGLALVHIAYIWRPRTICRSAASEPANR